MEETKSAFLTYLLEDGRRPVSKVASITSSSPTQIRGIRGLLFGKKAQQSLPPGREVGNGRDVVQVRHEIHLPAPDDASRMRILRCHITTRNFLALLYDKPLVGLTLYQALVDLHERLQMYLPKDVDCAEKIITYLVKNRLHNVCNDPAAAAGLLAWCEDFEVEWEQGWREAFVHCCGMYTQLKGIPEFYDISTTSRSLLEQSDLELRHRLQEAEDRLCGFQFERIWPPSITTTSSVRCSFERCRQFFKDHYGVKYKSWPPRDSTSSHGQWLSKYVATDMQRGFGALYDFFVDRNVVWDNITKTSDRHRSLISKSSQELVGTNDYDIPLAKILAQHDHQQGNSNIPCPYPLLPSPPASNDGVQQVKSPLFGSRSKSLEKQTAQQYSLASNAASLGQEKTITNALVEAFLRFEKADALGDTSPREARMGRWVLIYCVLQVLSTISVDTPKLFFTDVTYFINPQLKDMSPWKSASPETFESASQAHSHCWKLLPF